MVVPKTSDTVLSGVTRASAIHLMQHAGIDVVERKVTVDELQEAAQNGSLTEAFGLGTAATVSPICTLGLLDVIGTCKTLRIGLLLQRSRPCWMGSVMERVEDPLGGTFPCKINFQDMVRVCGLLIRLSACAAAVPRWHKSNPRPCPRWGNTLRPQFGLSSSGCQSVIIDLFPMGRRLPPRRRWGRRRNFIKVLDFDSQSI